MMRKVAQYRNADAKILSHVANFVAERHKGCPIGFCKLLWNKNSAATRTHLGLKYDLFTPVPWQSDGRHAESAFRLPDREGRA